MPDDVSFGRWLKAQRKAGDLTQVELARTIGCAVITIQKIEADRMRPSRQMAQRLADMLEIALEERDMFVQRARAMPVVDTASLSDQIAVSVPINQVNMVGQNTNREGSREQTGASNSFFHRGPVRDPTYFFGRAHEVAFLVDLLSQGQSVAISGTRRFGKTSLLFHLSHPDIAAAHGLGATTTRWVYLDGGVLDGVDEEGFYGLIDQGLGGESEALPYGRFVERLRTFATQSLRLILALDEFELIAANPLFSPALFNRLRGLAAQMPIQFITASKSPLVELTFAHRDTLSSPFFNIFAPLQLGLFAVTAANQMLETLSKRGGRPFAPELIMYLLALAGTHPLFLQVAGYRAFAALGYGQGNLDDVARAAVCAQVLADLDPHLRYYWSDLNAEAQYALAALPLLSEASGSPAVGHLSAIGLISNGAYLGAALELFVRHQRVAGLLQGGPFLMDLRRGVMAVGNMLLHLTPTEFAALKLFLERPGQVLTPEDIEARLWPGEIAPDPERARGIVKKLRAALGPAGNAIVNRRGQGYLLRLD